MQRCHITTEFVRTKQLCESSVCESSVYERLNEWYLSPPHAAGSSQTAVKSYPFPALYLLAAHGNLQTHKEVFSPTPFFPSSLNYKGSRSKDNTSDPGILNIYLNFNHSRENIQAET